MLGKLLKLSFALILLAVVASLYHFNSQEVLITYGPDSSLQTRLAHVLLFTFLAGIIVASLFALFFGFLNKLKMRNLRKEIDRLNEDKKLASDAREAMALNDLESARNILAKIIQRSPEDLAARVLLARTFQREGDTKAALGVLRQARAEQKKNGELLILGAELNSALGNETAAYDNAAMILESQPRNAHALRDLVDRSLRLSRPDDAVEHQEQLVKLLSGEEYTAARDRLTELRVEAVVQRHSGDPERLRTELESLLKQNRKSETALEALASVEEAAGNQELAAKLLKKAFSLNYNPRHLKAVSELWIKAQKPSRAVEDVSQAVISAEKKQDIPAARLVYVRLLLELEMNEAARAEFERLEASEAGWRHQPGYALIKSEILRREGKNEEASSLLAETVSAGESPARNPAVRH